MSDSPRKLVLCCVGTRPEVIKMAPVIDALAGESWARCRVLVTGQHRDLLDETLAFFGITPDADLDVMTPDQSLAALTARLLVALDDVLTADRPDVVLAEGDTTTVLSAAMACFYRKVPFAHVEAGLRSGDLAQPFPEEANRILATRLSAIHFAPTAAARENLLNEGVSPESVHVVGNPVIDSLLLAARRDEPIGVPLDASKRLVLVTAHRRENLGPRLRDICRAVRRIVRTRDDVQVLWPVHPNPSVGPIVNEMLGGEESVHLCGPMQYGRFVAAMKRAELILTDSGGLQEEAPALGKPVLVMREVSERTEALAAGVAMLVGAETDRIVREVCLLLDDSSACRNQAGGTSPYGDGNSAGRIVRALRRFLHAPPISSL